jgi:broad specificity phosphatase PhoE
MAHAAERRYRGEPAAMLYLVRHAEAGDKHLWFDQDTKRPLTPFGRIQSEALVVTLAEFPIGRVVSSPTARCVQTIEPLARSRGLHVETDLDLAVDAAEASVAGLATRLSGDAAVLCTHGEVIGALLGELFANGLAKPPGRARWQKGSVWVLDGSSARYLPPAPA